MILNHDGEMQERHESPLPPPGGVGSHSVHDGASSTESGGLFSGADAAIMAQAFRTTLRKPDFMGSPVEEGDSPDQDDLDADDNLMGGMGRHDSSALGKELAEEGRDIRSVSSSRGVRIESHPLEPATSTEESR